MLTGYRGLHDPSEIGSHAAAVVNWAQDPCASEAKLVPYLTAPRERGGTVVTIDPRVTQTAALSDLHIRPRLGSDAWLAGAVANLLIRSDRFDREFVEHHAHGFDAYRRAPGTPAVAGLRGPAGKPGRHARALRALPARVDLGSTEHALANS